MPRNLVVGPQQMGEFLIIPKTKAAARRPRPVFLDWKNRLGLLHLAGLEAARADAHALRVALAVRRADRLEVRHEATLRDAGRVETDAALILRRTLADDDVADRRTLAANFANSGHFPVPFV